jgi:outer membrane protein
MSRFHRLGWLSSVAVGAIACAATVLGARDARAATLDGALVEAYQGNPTLNAQRASTRATDENVPQALSGYRPRVSVTVNGGEQTLSSTTRVTGSTVNADGPAQYFTQSGYNAPFSAGATITQTLFNGFQTANRTRQAEAQVLAARATLYNTEQTVLLSAVTAYMNVLLDGAILDLQRRNVEVLQEQLRQTRDRFNVGEVTRTDVA